MSGQLVANAGEFSECIPHGFHLGLGRPEPADELGWDLNGVGAGTSVPRIIREFPRLEQLLVNDPYTHGVTF